MCATWQGEGRREGFVSLAESADSQDRTIVYTVSRMDYNTFKVLILLLKHLFRRKGRSTVTLLPLQS